MGYYSAIKVKKILPYATTWMSLEDIMLHEMSVIKRQTMNDFIYLRYLG